MRNKLGYFLFLTVVGTAVLGGWLGDRVSAGSSPDQTEDLLKTFTESLAVVQANFVKEVSTDELVESSIRGMLRTLDPHSSYFAQPDYNRLQEEQQGKYFGLGITIRAETPGSGRVLIVEPPAPGTPAYKAGLQARDVISKVNGEPIDDWDLNEQVIPNLKGPKGTTVNITIERPGELEPLQFTVERDEIPLYTIKFAFFVQPGIGYIRIDKFSETTGDELNKALGSLNEASLNGLILDLRDNPGGSLSAAIAVSDHFLKKGQLVVSTRSRGGVLDRSYRTRRGTEYAYPMVVLINQNSASASEIVSGALQDHDRALIVGETSFGKALVQTIYPLEGNRGLALTTGKYYTPSDRLIQRDYSEGFYNYFYSRREGQVGQSGVGNNDEHATDAGRKVYSGGGITPDEEIKPKTFSRLARQVVRSNAFFQFATKLISGEIPSDQRYKYSREEVESMTDAERQGLVQSWKVDDKIFAAFRDYVRETNKNIEFSAEEFEADREVFSNRLQQEIALAVLGEKDGYLIALRLDNQVQRAIELLPEAQTLARNAAGQ